MRVEQLQHENFTYYLGSKRGKWNQNAPHLQLHVVNVCLRFEGLGQEVAAPDARPTVIKQRARYEVLLHAYIQTVTSMIFRARPTNAPPPETPRTDSRSYLSLPRAAAPTSCLWTPSFMTPRAVCVSQRFVSGRRCPGSDAWWTARCNRCRPVDRTEPSRELDAVKDALPNNNTAAMTRLVPLVFVQKCHGRAETAHVTAERGGQKYHKHEQR